MARGKARDLATDPDVLMLIDGVAQGLTFNAAAAYAGIPISSLYDWITRGKEAKSGQYYDFYMAIQQAQAKQAYDLLTPIQKAAREGKWQAAAWLLERRHGYYKPPTSEVQANITYAGAGPDQPSQPAADPMTAAGREDLIQALMSLPLDVQLEAMRRAKAVQMAKAGKAWRGGPLKADGEDED